jgi:3-(3-hydroxy-phenyl)propionate hydroxylase
LTSAYDVIVIGAGPTGLAAGLFLRAHGMRVALLEREAATVVEPRAVTLDDESMRAMATLGLIPQLQPLILPGYGTRWYTGTGRELARVSANATRYGYGCRNGFSQPDFVNLLARTLAERAELRFESTVTSVEQDADGVTVKARGADGWPETYRARFAIACDGAASPIREGLGIQLEGDTHAQPWLIVDTVNSTETDRYSKFYCGNPRPYVAVPGRDGRLRYEFMYLPGEDPEQMRSADDVRRWLQGRRDLRDEDIIRIAVYRFHSRVSPRWRSGRLFFAGDAAHLMPPFAGQGMNAGIRDAFNLGWKLGLVGRGHATDALLDTYERERKPHVRAMLKLSEIIGTVVMSRDSMPAKVRDVFLGTARHVPGLREYIAEMRFKPKASYRDGFVHNKGAFKRLTGRLAPNPMVVDEHNLPRRLDDVLGDGFALLSVSASGNPVVPRTTSPMLAALNPRHVRLCSGEFIALPQPGCITVADTHAAFARELGLGRDAIVLVRPDRVIAAATTPTTFTRAEQHFSRTYSS